MDNLSGKLIKGYQLNEVIGVGAFAAVYRARQVVVERDVAIKVIWPTLADHPNFIRHFENEAQLVASLEHPYIVPLYDYWREPGGAYIVMRWLRGGHLRDGLTSDQWSIGDTVRVVDQVASALALAHRYGVIHCDLKPENILLDEERNAYLADFGIAQLASKAHNGNGASSSFGSLAYAAPEQLVNQPPTPETDVYSLGVMLYEMLTGQHPFPQLADLPEDDLLALRVRARLPSLLDTRPDLPSALDHVIQRAAALHPSDRYADTLSLVSAFRDTLGLGQPLDVQKGQPSDTLPNPYKGLRAFQETDAPYFFGRETLIYQLIERLKEPGRYARFLAVVGPSGSGKSSLVKAGLIPTLRQAAIPGAENWFYVEMVPGTDPFKELASALVSVAVRPPADLPTLLRRDEMGLVRAIEQVLPDSQAELFLFIDQFEELYTLAENNDATRHFLDSLFTAVTAPNSRVRVVVTLRADFYDRPLLHPRVSNLIRNRTEVVTPLTPQELERVITQPARQAGILIDSGVVATLITEFNEQAGALPLLQYSLSLLFERREGHWITSAVYKEIGGVRGALARRADDLFESFTPEQQEITRQLFLRLVSLGEGTEDTRRRESMTEIMSISTDQAALNVVIGELCGARFLTFDRDPITRQQTVEVAHETLIREWERLRRWLDASRNDVRMQRHLASLVAEWTKANRDASFLLRGSRLDQYAKWAKETDLVLTGQEEAFVRASLAEHEQYRAEQQARLKHEAELERRAFNRLRQLVAVLSGAMVLALFLAAIALNQGQNAREERNRAESARATSDANAAISHSMALKASALQALENGDGDLAVRLALQAAEEDDSALSHRTLSEVALAPGTRRQFVGTAYSVNGVAISPNNRLIAAASNNTTARLRLWDAETGQLVYPLIGHTGDVHSVAFSPDGQMIVSGSDDFVAILWDTQTGQAIYRLIGHQNPVRHVAFSADGQYVFTASTDGTLIEWEVSSGQPYRYLEGHTANLIALSLSPDGQSLLACAIDRRCLIWDTARGAETQRFEVSHPIRGAALGLDQQVVLGSLDGTLTLFDGRTGEPVRQFGSRQGEIGSIVFDPGGQTVLVGEGSGSLRLWDVTTGTELYHLQGHTDVVNSVVFNQDGRLAVSGSKDGTLRLWNMQDPAELQQFTGAEDRITGIAFAADDRQTLITSSIDGFLRFWDMRPAPTLRHQLHLGSPITCLTVSTDKQLALIGLKSGYLEVVELATSQKLLTLSGHRDSVLSVAISSDQHFAVSGSQDGLVIVWDLTTGQPLYELSGHDGPVTSVAISPDDGYVLSGGRDHSLILWNVQTGAEVRRLVGHAGAVYAVAISRAGQRALTGGRDAAVILWDLHTGREITRFMGHTQPVWSVAFAPEGPFAVSGAADGVILWDIPSSTDVQRLAPEGTPFALAISPDGQTVVIGEEQGIVQVGQLFTLETLIEWTRSHRYLRDWTCLEQELYQIGAGCEEPS
jgi:WD40 repeat protein/serine/threonine protein kinase